MGKMDCTPILSVKVSVSKIKCAANKNSDVDGTCKGSLIVSRKRLLHVLFALQVVVQCIQKVNTLEAFPFKV